MSINTSENISSGTIRDPNYLQSLCDQVKNKENLCNDPHLLSEITRVHGLLTFTLRDLDETLQNKVRQLQQALEEKGIFLED